MLFLTDIHGFPARPSQERQDCLSIPKQNSYWLHIESLQIPYRIAWNLRRIHLQHLQNPHGIIMDSPLSPYGVLTESLQNLYIILIESLYIPLYNPYGIHMESLCIPCAVRLVNSLQNPYRFLIESNAYHIILLDSLQNHMGSTMASFTTLVESLWNHYGFPIE